MPPQTSMPMLAALGDQANQPVKKKLKLKNFEDSLITTKDEPDYTESYFDHSLFNNYQLANNGPTKSQFIDQATEAELLDIEPTDTLASTIQIEEQQLTKRKSVLPTATTTTKLPQITNPVNYDFDTLGTDLDLDNLFESDENSNDCHMTDVQNVIKLAARPSTHSWNLEYHQQTSEELLNSGSVKVALKTLMVPAPAALAVSVTKDDDTNHGQTSRVDTTTGFEDNAKTNETTGFRLPSPASSENVSTASKTVLATNFSSSDSLASITSTTQLTPPSPSPPASQQSTTNVNSAVVPAVSNDQQVKGVNAQSQQQQQTLNKITLLSSSQTNGFNSQLNKVLIEY